jgi:hypothetical protein
MCHCEPFAPCHSERSEGEESNHFAQGKLREAISRDCHVASLLAMTTFQDRSL